jgi:hypothetical protein
VRCQEWRLRLSRPLHECGGLAQMASPPEASMCGHGSHRLCAVCPLSSSAVLARKGSLALATRSVSRCHAFFCALPCPFLWLSTLLVVVLPPSGQIRVAAVGRAGCDGWHAQPRLLQAIAGAALCTVIVNVLACGMSAAKVSSHRTLCLAVDSTEFVCEFGLEHCTRTRRHLHHSSGCF